MQLVHEDDRRTLYGFPEAKLIVAKTDTVIGNHYHKIKEELFILSEGQCMLYRSGEKCQMELGRVYTVAPGVEHTFHLTEGSILIGLNSHPYDASDDYRI